MKPRWLAIRARIVERARGLAAARWTKPALRLMAVCAGLVLLAAIGRGATLGTGIIGAALAAGTTADPTSGGTPMPTAMPTPSPIPTPMQGPTAMPLQAPMPMQGPMPMPMPTPAGAATVESPIVLNVATLEDLQRLPGIGPKKADAIVALRQRLGRFRQVEDLMKVKGIGRATIRRLRPLVRIDPLPQPVPSLPSAGPDASTA